MQASHALAHATRADVRARVDAGASLLIPVGALEQHGSHLPIGTDALVVESLCLEAARCSSRDILVSPAVWTGFSPHHRRFGATVSLRASTFLDLLTDIATESRLWCPRILFVNGHGGNRGLLTAIALESEVHVISYWELEKRLARELFRSDYGSIGHAGSVETSLIGAIDPHWVAVPDRDFESVAPDDDLRAPELGPSGVIGNPHVADDDAGRRYFKGLAAGLAAYAEALW